MEKYFFIRGFQTSKDKKLQWFQTRILHHILPTEKYLYICICQKQNSSNFKFCNDLAETLKRSILGMCNGKRILAKSFKTNTWKLTHCVQLYFCPGFIIFDFANGLTSDRMINFIILFAKLYIYRRNLNERDLDS